MAKKTERQVMKFDEAEQISWLEEDEIDGLYLGLKPFIGDNQQLLYIVFFKDEETGKLKSCTGSYKILEFLKLHKFKQGYYLKIKKIDTILLDGGRKLNKFAFECDPEGIGLEDEADQFMSVEDCEIDVMSNFELARQKVSEMKQQAKDTDDVDDLKFLDED